MKLYNTLSKSIEDFVPLEENKVKIFVCGPTVYDYAHIGHARTYVFFDTLIKYLRFKGYDVDALMNITDIDDKIINRAREEGRDWKEIADFFTKAFWDDMKKLKINSFNRVEPATSYIKEIVEQIKILKEKGIAYVIEDDGIYFEIPKFKEYGKLSGQNLKDLLAGARVEKNDKKKSPYDFVLWKFKKEGEPFWETEIGAGRPGWHIEDTAISITLFGEQYDLHGGGLDLIFPHHECEIAIAESITGKVPFVKYWVHTGFVNVKGEKMSKSLKNFVTVREILEKYSPEALRHFFLSTHYRSPIDYDPQKIVPSENAVQRIYEFLVRLKAKSNESHTDSLQELFNNFWLKFEEEMDNDFNTPKAIAAFFNLLSELNNFLDQNELSEDDINFILDQFKKVDSILGIIPFARVEEEIPEEVWELVERREKARKERNFDLADKLREEIISLGYYVDDTPQGPIVKKIKKEE